MRNCPEIVIVRGNLEYELSELLPRVLYSAPGEALGEAYLEICLFYRRLGICVLLTRLNVGGFANELAKAGKAYEHFVSHSSDADAEYVCTSRATPYFDMLAAGDIATARRIEAIAPRTWEREHEFEDEFLYMRFLMDLVSSNSSPIDRDPMIERMQKLPDLSPGKLAICEALHAAEDQAFEEAMELMLEERAEDVAEARSLPIPSEAYFLETEAFIFVEGIAIVRLARLIGIRTHHEYPGIPSQVFTMDTLPRGSRVEWRNAPEV
jgi:hypothetical protein